MVGERYVVFRAEDGKGKSAGCGLELWDMSCTRRIIPCGYHWKVKWNRKSKISKEELEDDKDPKRNGEKRKQQDTF